MQWEGMGRGGGGSYNVTTAKEILESWGGVGQG